MKFDVQRDGLNLSGVYEPAAEPNGSIAIVMHGFTANRNFPLVEQLAENIRAVGISTVRFDFDGCGESDGDFVDMTVPKEIADAQAVLMAVKSRLQPQHIILVGHSQGGVVASMLAGYYADEIQRLVLLAPAATLKSDALNGETKGLTYDPRHIPDRLKLTPELTLGGFYLRTAQQLPIYEVAKSFRGPVCLIHGDADSVVNYHASVHYNEVYANSTFHLIPGAEHGLTGEAVSSQVLKIVKEFVIAK